MTGSRYPRSYNRSKFQRSNFKAKIIHRSSDISLSIFKNVLLPRINKLLDSFAKPAYRYALILMFSNTRSLRKKKKPFRKMGGDKGEEKERKKE